MYGCMYIAQNDGKTKNKTITNVFAIGKLKTKTNERNGGSNLMACSVHAHTYIWMYMQFTNKIQFTFQLTIYLHINGCMYVDEPNAVCCLYSNKPYAQKIHFTYYFCKFIIVNNTVQSPKQNIFFPSLIALKTTYTYLCTYVCTWSQCKSQNRRQQPKK